MTIKQALQTEIDESKKWLEREYEESTYKRDLQKRIELINWTLENMKKLQNRRITIRVLTLKMRHNRHKCHRHTRPNQRPNREGI